MPEIPGFVSTIEYLKTLHKSKNDDYSGDKGAFFNFEFCDIVASLFQNTRDKVYATFLAVKLARLAVTLSAKKVNHESIEDTFNDLINYSVIWKCDYIERNKKPIHLLVEEATIRESKPK
jgi:hypothetical protein